MSGTANEKDTPTLYKALLNVLDLHRFVSYFLLDCKIQELQLGIRKGLGLSFPRLMEIESSTGI